jgi:hypothetical protein
MAESSKKAANRDKNPFDRRRHAEDCLSYFTQQAAKGDKSARAQMDKIFAEYPELRSTVTQLGGPYAWAVATWCKTIADGDQLRMEAIRARVDRLEAEMFRPDAGELKRTLAEDLILAYLAHRQAQIWEPETLSNATMLAARDRHLEATERRLASARAKWNEFLAGDLDGRLAPVPASRQHEAIRRPSRRPNGGRRPGAAR